MLFVNLNDMHYTIKNKKIENNLTILCLSIENLWSLSHCEMGVGYKIFFILHI